MEELELVMLSNIGFIFMKRLETEKELDEILVNHIREYEVEDDG